MPNVSMIVVCMYRGLCRLNERRYRLKTSVLVNDGPVNCDTSSMTLKFCATKWCDRFHWLTDFLTQGNVATRLRWGGILMITLLQMSQRMRQWKNFENVSVFDEFMCSLLEGYFLAYHVGLLANKNNVFYLDVCSVTYLENSFFV